MASALGTFSGAEGAPVPAVERFDCRHRGLELARATQAAIAQWGVRVRPWWAAGSALITDKSARSAAVIVSPP